MIIELELPYPPSVNHYKSIGRTVRTPSGKMYQQRINSKATIQFYHEVHLKIRELYAFKRVLRPIEGTIYMEVYLYPPDKRKRDVDGPLKALLDSMQRGGLYKDDCQIQRLLVVKEDLVNRGKVLVNLVFEN